MLEDGLEDVEKLFTEQLNKYYYTEQHNKQNDNSKIKTPQTTSLTDTCLYTVELPTSEHWRLKVKV